MIYGLTRQLARYGLFTDISAADMSLSRQTNNATRRYAKATMDHADIRGLVTAFHLSVAGLPAV